MTTELWVLVGLLAVIVVVTVVIAVRLLVRMTRLRGQLRAVGAPRSGRLAFWLAVAYLVCPVDLLPDPVLLDDIGVLVLAVRSLGAGVRAAHEDGLPRDRDEEPRRVGA
ncbi:YkvA family protein [Streptomyces meridianus]|uniref:YkvA family protein n=1 Tax=Streptomyces meridianus TaxID=2938945 RepID=A0ABT0XDU2_9ACTN|nr:YkvA family protein [Streptomyces meridianus]MCM2579932.1 YkvA family protein [Streptomyces meridianus]